MQARYKLSNKNVSEFLYSCYEKDKRERERERGSKKGLLAATKTTPESSFPPYYISVETIRSILNA